MVHLILAAADGLTLTPTWLLGVLAGSGTVIGVLFKLLINSKDREIARIQEDFDLFKEQVQKDELRREKEDARLELLIEEAMRVGKSDEPKRT